MGKEMRTRRAFWAAKRGGDILGALTLLPVLSVIALLLLILNPWLNPGPLMFRQPRIGRHNSLFLMIKFRTMRPAPPAASFADREQHRITPFAQYLRRFRLDELPQILNVLRGEMSLIGPRPEQPAFVRHYSQTLPGYARRHRLRPGISGLSQVRQGYTCDADGAAQKLALDLEYIDRAGMRLDGHIFWRTLVTVTTGFGAL